MNSRIVGIVGTLVIHLAVLLALQPASIPPPPPPPPGQPPGNEEPPEKHDRVKVRLLSKSKSDKEYFIAKNRGLNGRPDPRICQAANEQYEGIGIIYSPWTSLVLSAPAEYPAYKAGMRVGDMLVDLKPDVVDGWLTHEVVRHDKRFKFRIHTDKICFVKDKNRKNRS